MEAISCLLGVLSVLATEGVAGKFVWWARSAKIGWPPGGDFPGI